MHAIRRYLNILRETAEVYPKTIYVVEVPPTPDNIRIMDYDDFGIDAAGREFYYYFDLAKAKQTMAALRKYKPVLKTEDHEQPWVARYKSRQRSQRPENVLIRQKNLHAEQFWDFEYVRATTPEEAKRLVKRAHPDALDIYVVPGNASDMIAYSAGRKVWPKQTY